MVDEDTDLLGSEDSSLLTRLVRTPKLPEPVPPKILRKYIGYAKKYCPTPKLTPEACDILQEFYISLRQNQVRS